MSVSLNTSYTASTRTALAANLQEAVMASTAMSTGNAITHAYQDPTGLAIGSNMKASYDVLSVVATGIEQSQSMLYIAEDGLKSAYNVVTQMNKVLARAKLGYMTDDLIQKTLSPTYQQLKAEINRIADEIDFNGQKLLNGSGGTQNAGTAAKAAATATYNFNKSTVSLTDISIANAGGTTNGNGSISSISSPSHITVEGGNITYDGTETSISNATITLSGATITDSNGKHCLATVTLTGVALKVTTTTTGASSFSLSGISGNDIGSSSANITNSSGGITSITGLSIAATDISSTAGTIDNVNTYYPLTGGVEATSTFQFVTGTDLTNSIVKVNFPNIKLITSNVTTSNGSTATVQGLISTLNTNYNINPNAPVDLTDLTGVADANTDISLVQALSDALITQLDNIGAYEERFIDIQSQLSTAVEQLDLAQGAILNTDLSKEIENFTRASVEVNVSIAMLKNLNSLLQSLQNLVV